MRVMTILGTRPEIIRLSRIIEKLDQLADKHILVHTGQNYDHRLSDIFFKELNLRNPDHHIQLTSHSFGNQVGQMFQKVEALLEQEKPDRVLLLGDTNSALCTILAERMGIPVYHMEAGNRCFDPLVPEELNRKCIDAAATFNLPYTEYSRQNLLREGCPSQRIWVTGNPIYEVLQYYSPEIEKSKVACKWNLQMSKYILTTVHRAENVDTMNRLRNIMQSLSVIAKRHDMPILVSVHPHTRKRLEQYGLKIDHPKIHLLDPLGFFDFVYLQKGASCVITDSGTVQEESCIFGVPAVTVRRTTERPETVMCGSNVVSGVDDINRIVDCVELMLSSDLEWKCPEGYEDCNVSNKVVNMVLGGFGDVQR
ncbi:non-hydrolyzing UDP-N-acetylglucosamine 2-epimerase [Mechercharimyces sp. CAU 1602]|uniref:non-hydrolyzing UDP-N-acetylglucosamine 2-epimerase n=1 Tax=Mechercharimyces sp. CAU 1602 TaxID=2973933 RepID=UPI002162EC2C|nr:UDP-N-acetylglucosamine 2-epimerase (non-hydrolyzing) [Mechercharimyces sp. CAU 1602]MCS1350158.1 UDP-N-acetylglucosamine 2-epimerase (non-hydrolyzing) [Mechercharimyces sp. CAU 1602]